MNSLLKRYMRQEKGQGLVEYTLIVLLVVLVFWVGIKNTNIGGALESSWNKIKACVDEPTGAACKNP